MPFDIIYTNPKQKMIVPAQKTPILVAPVLPFRASEFLHGRIETTRIVRRSTR
jgi:hypothetical protein